MGNHEQFAHMLVDPLVKRASDLENGGNPIGREIGLEIRSLLTKNLHTLQSDGWKIKVERALETGRNELAAQGLETGDFKPEQLRDAMISILSSYLHAV